MGTDRSRVHRAAKPRRGAQLSLQPEAQVEQEARRTPPPSPCLTPTTRNGGGSSNNFRANNARCGRRRRLWHDPLPQPILARLNMAASIFPCLSCCPRCRCLRPCLSTRAAHGRRYRESGVMVMKLDAASIPATVFAMAERMAITDAMTSPILHGFAGAGPRPAT